MCVSLSDCCCNTGLHTCDLKQPKCIVSVLLWSCTLKAPRHSADLPACRAVLWVSAHLLFSWWSHCQFSASLECDVVLLHCSVSKMFYSSSVVCNGIFFPVMLTVLWTPQQCDWCSVNKWWLRGCIMSCFGFRVQVSKVSYGILSV